MVTYFFWKNASETFKFFLLLFLCGLGRRSNGQVNEELGRHFAHRTLLSYCLLIPKLLSEEKNVIIPSLWATFLKKYKLKLHWQMQKRGKYIGPLSWLGKHCFGVILHDVGKFVAPQKKPGASNLIFANLKKLNYWSGFFTHRRWKESQKNLLFCNTTLSTEQLGPRRLKGVQAQRPHLEVLWESEGHLESP